MRSTYLLLMATLWVAVLTVLHAEFPSRCMTPRPVLSLVIYEAACFPCCRAFQNGRAIAKAGAPEAMLAAMRECTTGAERASQLVTAVCGALRRIAVNDDICTEYADAGGVAVTMQVSATCTGHHPRHGEVLHQVLCVFCKTDPNTAGTPHLCLGEILYELKQAQCAG